jgi:predicted NBD/HSP70 family sugar kinase
MELSEKHKNIVLVLQHIIKTKEASATDIAEATGLSFSTISRALAVLKELSMACTLGSAPTETMGRRPEKIGLNGAYGYYLHFYVEAERIRGWLADFNSQILNEGHVNISRGITPDIFSQKLGELARRLFAKTSVDFGRLVAVSMAVPGMVDEKNRRVSKIPNLYGIQNTNLFAIAQEVLGAPVFIANEARLCVLGEYLENTWIKNIVYVDITKYSGIGAGILLDGKLYVGSNTIAGELGDVFVDTGSFDREYSEHQGCLETVAGLDTLVSCVKKLAAGGRAQRLAGLMAAGQSDSPTLSMIEKAAMRPNCDEEVSAVFEETLKMWCLAVISLFVVLDPQEIILGGVIGPENAYTLQRMRSLLGKAVRHDFKLRISGLGEIAQLRGGLHLLENYVFENILIKRVAEHLGK